MYINYTIIVQINMSHERYNIIVGNKLVHVFHTTWILELLLRLLYVLS